MPAPIPLQLIERCFFCGKPIIDAKPIVVIPAAQMTHCAHRRCARHAAQQILETIPEEDDDGETVSQSQ